MLVGVVYFLKFMCITYVFRTAYCLMLNV
ncbi:hypothetical protein KL86CLO1_11853 [uncultured Eubacteriales bacterium]|uniref:Uncharacterized protein n=1 Tax=uncultured Eubacteriales bacterium TaxID=172733 RepID=A0A212JX17_9FIRM|nr:hypothetical protein KL86CLO1_11853 [uncultured Eubacteriales bacterium]